MPVEQLTEKEAEHQKKIDDAVKRRAQAVRDEQEATKDIAMLVQEAREDGVVMRLLANWVKVLDPVSGELRSVTRQSIDGMLAKLEGRERAPRRRGRKAASSDDGAGGKINTAAFT